MPAEGHILVTFSSVMDAAGDTDTIATQIDGELDNLRAYIAPLVSTWTGTASTDYQALQKKWDTSADELNAVLREIAGALRTAHTNYQTTENTNAGMWR